VVSKMSFHHFAEDIFHIMNSCRRVAAVKGNILPLFSELKNYVKVWHKNLLFRFTFRIRRTFQHDSGMLFSAVQYILPNSIMAQLKNCHLELILRLSSNI
jgi:hypothetical protein